MKRVEKASAQAKESFSVPYTEITSMPARRQSDMQDDVVANMEDISFSDSEAEQEKEYSEDPFNHVKAESAPTDRVYERRLRRHIPRTAGVGTQILGRSRNLTEDTVHAAGYVIGGVYGRARGFLGAVADATGAFSGRRQQTVTATEEMPSSVQNRRLSTREYKTVTGSWSNSTGDRRRMQAMADLIDGGYEREFVEARGPMGRGLGLTGPTGEKRRTRSEAEDPDASSSSDESGNSGHDESSDSEETMQGAKEQPEESLTNRLQTVDYSRKPPRRTLRKPEQADRDSELLSSVESLLLDHHPSPTAATEDEKPAKLTKPDNDKQDERGKYLEDAEPPEDQLNDLEGSDSDFAEGVSWPLSKTLRAKHGAKMDIKRKEEASEWLVAARKLDSAGFVAMLEQVDIKMHDDIWTQMTLDEQRLWKLRIANVMTRNAEERPWKEK